MSLLTYFVQMCQNIYYISFMNTSVMDGLYRGVFSWRGSDYTVKVDREEEGESPSVTGVSIPLE